ncbi:MAG: hypothetical protein MUE41_03055, partial [Gemmatimonadaceae bacterium]|nr:hypothetical protein [Gemmatimonadaceae bacterium]
MRLNGPPTRLAKITGIHRWSEGAHFDHDDYGTAHATLTIELLAPRGLLRLEADRTNGTTEPRPGEIVATSNADFASVAVARAALASAGAALAADIPRYTNIRPVLH